MRLCSFSLSRARRVWLAAQDANQTSTWQLIQDYFAHNISVGAINLDSNWESGWTDFLPRTSAYPAIADLIDQFHSAGLRVICWATSMIDTDSPNFQTAESNGYLILNGLNETGLMKWWHGVGGLLDYTNPAALSWWQSQMDQALSLGIDGWKNDGTDPFIMELIDPRTSAGQPITYREYADSYYGSFFDYSREKIGPDALTMSRPVDSVEGVYLAYSPLRVMTSGWVGDNDASFGGLIDCAKKVLQSAWRGYANYGCDIGGYRIGNRTKELFLRWAAFGAFLPLMENGGENNHRSATMVGRRARAATVLALTRHSAHPSFPLCCCPFPLFLSLLCQTLVLRCRPAERDADHRLVSSLRADASIAHALLAIRRFGGTGYTDGRVDSISR